MRGTHLYEDDREQPGKEGRLKRSEHCSLKVEDAPLGAARQIVCVDDVLEDD